jgi:hypothetical protein
MIRRQRTPRRAHIERTDARERHVGADPAEGKIGIGHRW